MIETVKLDNGLTIYFYLDKRKHTTFVNLVTKFGGIIKDFKLDGTFYHVPDGIAHVLEHYIVESNEIGEYTKILGKKHMSTNATTSTKKTSYYFECVNDLEYGLNILLKSCYSPVFTKENLEKVKKPIYQEIRMISDNKFNTAYKKKMNALFHNVKYRDIGGSEEDLNKIDIELLHTCYKAFYQPKNQFLVVAGNFNKNKILKVIKNIYKEIKYESHDLEIIDLKEKETVKQKRCILKVPTAQEYTSITYKISLKDFNNREKLKLDFYLNFYLKMKYSIVSPLYKELVDEKIITYSLDFSDSIIDKYLLVTIGCYTDKSSKLIKKIREKTNIEDLSQEMFELLKKELFTRVSIRPENIHSMVSPFVENVIEYDYPYFDTVDDVKSLNYEEFIKFINKLDFNEYTITYMKNNE